MAQVCRVPESTCSPQGSEEQSLNASYHCLDKSLLPLKVMLAISSYLPYSSQKRQKNLLLLPLLPPNSVLRGTREHLERYFVNSTCSSGWRSTGPAPWGCVPHIFGHWWTPGLPGQGAAVCVGGQGTRGGTARWETQQLCSLQMSWS